MCPPWSHLHTGNHTDAHNGSESTAGSLESENGTEISFNYTLGINCSFDELQMAANSIRSK